MMTIPGPVPLQKTPSRIDLARYAAATNDYSPIHFDSEHARSVGLPGVIAHGLLTLGYVGQFLADWVGDPGAIRRTRLRLLEPVRPGDDLVVEATAISDIAPLYEVKIVVRRGPQVVAAGDATVDMNGSTD